MKHGMMVAAAMLAASVAGPAMAAANSFNLTCKGVQEKKTGMASATWSESFRIDLDAKRWCRGACRSGSAISEIGPDSIVIRDSRATTGGPADVVLSLSRIDGKISEFIEVGWSGSTFELANGTCTKGTYTGIPANRF